MSDDIKKDGNAPLREVKFHFLKSPHYRVVHCDGVVGGPAPNGAFVTAAMFSERGPIPTVMIHSITEEGRLGDEITDKRISKEGVVREVEVELIMSLAVAEKLGNWLLGHVKNVNDQLNPREPNK